MAGWIYSYGLNKKGCLAAALLQGGLSGFLKIKYNDGLLKVDKARNAQTGEEKTFERYLTFPLIVVDKYSAKLERFMLDFSDFLEQKAQEKYFTSDTLMVFLGSAPALALTTGLCFFCRMPVFICYFGNLSDCFHPSGKKMFERLHYKKIPRVSFWGVCFARF